jgi:hypothetical protein
MISIDIMVNLESFVESAVSIVDSGSKGLKHAIYCAKINKNANIYAFETADPKATLQKLVDLDIRNVTLLECKPGHINGIIPIEGEEEKVGGMTIKKPVRYTKMITIDSLNMQSCDYVYVDADFEEFIIQGAMQTFKKFKPVVVFFSKAHVNIFKNMGYEMAHYSDMFVAHALNSKSSDNASQE